MYTSLSIMEVGLLQAAIRHALTDIAAKKQRHEFARGLEEEEPHSYECLMTLDFTESKYLKLLDMLKREI